MIRRVGIYLLSMLLASFLVFAVMSVLPGDPATVMLGTQATPESVAALRSELGLDRPIIVQYADWLAGLTDELASRAGSEARERMVTCFEQSVRHEIAFWDMAWGSGKG